MADKKKFSVKGAEFVRKFNAVTAIGKVAVAALFPASAAIMYPWAALDAVTAAGTHAFGKRLKMQKL